MAPFRSWKNSPGTDRGGAGNFSQPTHCGCINPSEVAGAKDKLVRERDNKFSKGGEIQRWVRVVYRLLFHEP